MSYVWVAERYHDGRRTYMDVFDEDEKERAKIEVSQKKGAIPEDFVWTGINYDEDESIEATHDHNDNIELNERLVVKKKRVKP